MTARVISPGSSGINTASAAAVVPPGEVTLILSCAADSGD